MQSCLRVCILLVAVSVTSLRRRLDRASRVRDTTTLPTLQHEFWAGLSSYKLDGAVIIFEVGDRPGYNNRPQLSINGRERKKFIMAVKNKEENGLTWIVLVPWAEVREGR